MKTRKDKTILSDQVKLTKLAVLKATDQDDFASCVADMKKYAHLGDDDAMEVAHAIRSKYMPSVLLELGLEGNDLAKEDGEDEGFAKEYKDESDEDEDLEKDNFTVLDDKSKLEDNDDFEKEDKSFEKDETDFEKTDEDFNKDLNEDSSEVEDEGIAMIQISVPADKLKEVEEALNGILKGEKMDVEPENEMSDDDTDIHSEGKKVENMNKEQLAMRKAERRAIVEAAIEEVEPKDIGLGHDTSGSGKPFKYDEANQYKGEVPLTVKKFEGGGKSDMSAGFPDYANQKVPTMNPEYLQLKGEIDAMQFSEKPANAADYEIDFNLVAPGGNPVPSDGSGRAEHEYEAPVMSEHDYNFNPAARRVASELGDLDIEKAEEILGGLLIEAGVEKEDISKMTYAEGIELYHAIKTASKGEFNETHGTQGVDEHPEYKGDPYKGNEAKKATEKITIETAEKEEDSSMIKRDAEKEKMAKELERARLKTAYACSYKLLQAGCLSDEEEAEEYVNTLLNDNLTATAMIRQSTLWLKSAQAIKSEKFAAAKNNGTVKTASNIGLSISPSIKTSSVDISGVQDLAESLRGLFTGSKTETGEEEN